MPERWPILRIDEKSFGKGQDYISPCSRISMAPALSSLLQVGQNQPQNSFFAASQTSNAGVSEPSLQTCCRLTQLQL
jgi:hypothetical protein